MWFDSYRDIALTVLGASGGLASLLLVFIGFLLSQAASFPPTVADSISQKYINRARLGLVPVSLCAIAMLTTCGWLFDSSSVLLLKVWTTAFGAALVTFAAYAIYAALSL